MPGVCLFVCLLATLEKKLLNGSSRKFYHRRSSEWGRGGYILGVIRLRIRIQEFFEGFFNIARYRRAFFHNSAHISEWSDRILMKMLLQMYPWTRKSLLNFGSKISIRSSDPTPDPEYAVSDCFYWSCFFLNCNQFDLKRINGVMMKDSWRNWQSCFIDI